MKRWIWIIVALLIIAVGIAGWAILRNRQASAALAALQTVPARRGQLTAVVGATGTVRANQNARLTYAASGEVGEIHVGLGESVGRDALLAELAADSLPTPVILARVDLVNARKALDDLLTSTVQAAQAEQNLVLAQEALNSAVRSWRFFRSASPRSTSYEQRSAQLQRSAAEERLTAAQIALVALGPDDPELPAAEQAVEDAQAELDLGNWLVAWYQGEIPGEIDHARLDASVALAQANLEEAQRVWERVAGGAHPDDIASAEARLAAAEATLASARVRAPFAGTITSVNASAGDLVSPGSAAFTLTDLSRLFVDVEISEVDINRVSIGQPVTLIFDAIPTQKYNGEVVEVALTGTALQGVVNFLVTIELLDADQAIRPGMTAAISIVVESVEDVLLVPNRAVRVNEGRRVVYILEDGLPVAVPIELGASSESDSEVVGGGLKEGDLIVLTAINNGINFGPPGGGMFGGRR